MLSHVRTTVVTRLQVRAHLADDVTDDGAVALEDDDDGEEFGCKLTHVGVAAEEEALEM